MIIQTKPEPSCPECGAKMVLRRPKPSQTWKPFWGCNRYPDCTGHLNINSDTGKPETEDESWEERS
jgi:ssDNA-binding Zn-finger/Zn-ribbon topoisomerase 1